MSVRNLQYALRPASVAVFGASERPGSLGETVTRNLLAGGFKGTHVPFRGGPEATMEVVAGRVDYACMGMSSVLGLVQEKKVMPLAVCTPQRSTALPAVPTTIEAGYPNSDYIFWNGLFVPARTPKDIIDRLYVETKKVLALPAVQEKFKPQGIERCGFLKRTSLHHGIEARIGLPDQ